ncbi:MAG TPA: zinc-dependent peptidase [Candidatus Hydrogenedentes bacterium]|nr:zinc-dependent peptidase [Candidatus Hydrogenedentota bacterium]
MFGFKNRRRARILKIPFPPEWKNTVARNLLFYRYLAPEDQRKLLGIIQILLSEKNFEGCGGLELTDEIKLTIAAHAALLILHQKTDYYPNLYSILVYPHAFFVKTSHRVPGMQTMEGEELRAGEAWLHGAVVLSWDGLLRSVQHPDDGYNVAFHEFAHQLDMENGAADGYPHLQNKELARIWPETMTREYQRVIDDQKRGFPTLIGRYGAQSPSEFFATMTECFFEIPHALRAQHPEAYKLLREFYQQDPASILPMEADSTDNSGFGSDHWLRYNMPSS